MNMQQPLDMNPDYVALVNAFPIGHAFTQQDVSRLLDVGIMRARATLDAIKDVLLDCPEGVQLIAVRGAPSTGGGHRFVLLE